MVLGSVSFPVCIVLLYEEKSDPDSVSNASCFKRYPTYCSFWLYDKGRSPQSEIRSLLCY